MGRRVREEPKRKKTNFESIIQPAVDIMLHRSELFRSFEDTHPSVDLAILTYCESVSVDPSAIASFHSILDCDEVAERA